jgi:hypothetical protein
MKSRINGRAFSSAAIELTLANYPGCYTTTPPTDATPYGIYWPTLVRADLVGLYFIADPKIVETPRRF